MDDWTAEQVEVSSVRGHTVINANQRNTENEINRKCQI